MIGDGGIERVDKMEIAGRRSTEAAGEKGGGDDGGNGLEGVKASSASILLSLSLVKDGSASTKSSTGEVDKDDKGAEDGSEITSGALPSCSLSLADSTEAGMDGAGSETSLEAIKTSVVESLTGADFRVKSTNERSKGNGSVLHRPRSADVRKHIERIPSSLNEKPGPSSAPSSCESGSGERGR